ncbi:MAG TPA: hypothetical protein HPP80_02935 [Rhodospirillaceae bacterium]|nr:hypothetical protein [Rhodospirillaceae bacterium]
MRMRHVLIITSIAFAISTNANASDAFSISANIVNGSNVQSISKSFDSVQSVINFFNNNKLSSFASTYTPNSGVNAAVTYLGVPVSLSYAQNSTSLTFKVPGIGLNQTFTGSSRDQSASQLEKFLKGNGASIVNQFQKYLTSNSDISPIAGNPGSLQSTMIANGFTSGAMNSAANASSPDGNRFGLGVSAGEFSVKGYSGTSYQLPLSYAYRFDNPGWQIQLNMPIGYQQIGTAQSYSAQLGAGLQIPLLTGVDWYLIPTVSAGATGSADLGAAGVLYSFAANNRYSYHATPNLTITLGNMVGQVNSSKVTISGYNIDPGVRNTVLKNGLSAEYKTDWTFWDEPLSIRAGMAYTDALGNKLAIANYSEFSLDFGTLPGEDAPFYKRLRLGATFATGAGYQAASLNFGYQF